MLAVCKGRVDIVRALLCRQCQLNQFDRLGRTALYLAVKSGFLQTVHELLLQGADPDAYVGYNISSLTDPVPSPTALHCAILYEKPEEALAIIQSGSQLDIAVLYEDTNRNAVAPCSPLKVACSRDILWAVRLLTAADPFLIRSFGGYGGTSSAIKDMLEETLQNVLKPQKLKLLCREGIRKALGGRTLFKKATSLPLPPPLIDYILMKDLEHII